MSAISRAAQRCVAARLLEPIGARRPAAVRSRLTRSALSSVIRTAHSGFLRPTCCGSRNLRRTNRRCRRARVESSYTSCSSGSSRHGTCEATAPSPSVAWTRRASCSKTLQYRCFRACPKRRQHSNGHDCSDRLLPWASWTSSSSSKRHALRRWASGGLNTGSTANSRSVRPAGAALRSGALPTGLTCWPATACA